MRLHRHDLQFLISLLIVLPAWITVWLYWESQPHVLLATNLITGVMGYWLGSSKGSSDKDKLVADMQPVVKHCCKGDEHGHTNVHKD